ncbi:MAG: gliding-motility protein MglA [Deltaproteobacteria bacterium]|nr:gliding-motility protein MglA [Deltaproteobacteria bacterium]
MSFINSKEKEINCKIAYVGAAFSGKSTSLHHIYEKTVSGKHGKMVSLSEKDGTLYFDFLPLSLGKVNGYTIRFHLYTVPGQFFHESARKMILKGVDGVVFVVDSRVERLEDTLKSWKNLQENLKFNDIDFQTAPIVLQYNKQDLKNLVPAEELNQLLNQKNLPSFESIATQGKQVMECFQSLAKSVLKTIK